MIYHFSNLFVYCHQFIDAYTSSITGVKASVTAGADIEILITDIVAADTKFYFNKYVLEGKKSGAGDDSIVRGTVFKDGMAPKAKNCGAKEFGAVISCPPLSHACVKDPGGKTFAAQGMKGTVESIRKRVADDLGLDFVLYPTTEDVVEAIGHKDLCMACFDGKYPVRNEFVPEDQLEQ